MSVGTHQTHCCEIHGCAYGEKDCPVFIGVVKQEYPCFYCPSGDDEDYYSLTITELHAVRDLAARASGYAHRLGVVLPTVEELIEILSAPIAEAEALWKLDRHYDALKRNRNDE